jgi:hypothetical protein
MFVHVNNLLLLLPHTSSVPLRPRWRTNEGVFFADLGHRIMWLSWSYYLLLWWVEPQPPIRRLQVWGDSLTYVDWFQIFDESGLSCRVQLLLSLLPANRHRFLLVPLHLGRNLSTQLCRERCNKPNISAVSVPSKLCHPGIYRQRLMIRRRSSLES